MSTHFASLQSKTLPPLSSQPQEPARPLRTALLVDESGYLSSHSRDVLGFLGYTPGLAPPRLNLLNHVAHWDRIRASRAMAYSLTSGREHQGTYTFTRPGGASFAARMVCIPCHCSGRPAGLKVSLSCC